MRSKRFQSEQHNENSGGIAACVCYHRPNASTTGQVTADCSVAGDRIWTTRSRTEILQVVAHLYLIKVQKGWNGDREEVIPRNILDRRTMNLLSSL